MNNKTDHLLEIYFLIEKSSKKVSIFSNVGRIGSMIRIRSWSRYYTKRIYIKMKRIRNTDFYRLIQ